MFHVILFEPEIPANTGNIVRLCANTGCTLHLVRPLGFAWDDRRLRRAGLDYHEWAEVRLHASLPACREALGSRDALGDSRLFVLSTHGGCRHDEPAFIAGDAFLFGPESRGLPAGVINGVPPERRLRIPMKPPGRSLNLANSVAVVVYEAWRQAGFAAGR